MLKQLTQDYIENFNAKDLEALSKMFADKFVLEDPVVKRLESKDKCLKAVSDIFTNYEKLSFSAKNIYVDNKTSFIEFILILDNTRLEGVDIIEWDENNKISELRAYLYEVVVNG